MVGIKNIKPVSLILRTVLLVVLMFLCFIVSALLAGLGGGEDSGDSGNALLALAAVCAVNALVLAYPIIRSRWRGVKLAAAIFLVQFGAETFMSQIETIFFGGAFNIPRDQMQRIILAGFLRALMFAPLAVLVLGKFKRGMVSETSFRGRDVARSAWIWRLALLPLFYVVIYILFGYFIAWQSPDVRQLYSGSTDIKPFFEHFADLVRNAPEILPFQYLRGLIWIGLALPIIRMMKGRAWESALAVGLAFGLLLTIQLLLPNPYMPAPVRLAHFIETSTSTFIYGALIAWAFHGIVSSRRG